MAASDRSAASANHQAQLSESSGSRSPALGLRRGCSVPPWPCGELDQALMAFAGEASAQVVLVAGEGIGDGCAALLEGGVPPLPLRRDSCSTEAPPSRCGHRVSVDLGLFTARPLERAALQRLLPWLKSSTVRQDQPGTLTVLSAGDALRLRFPGERSARCAGGFSPLATTVNSPRPRSSLDLSPSEPLR